MNATQQLIEWQRKEIEDKHIQLKELFKDSEDKKMSEWEEFCKFCDHKEKMDTRKRKINSLLND